MDTYSSLSVNGQLIPVLQKSAFNSGNATGPIYQGGPASPQTIPPRAGMGSAGASTASMQPFNFKTSPLPILIVMLVVGVLGLRYVHWRS